MQLNKFVIGGLLILGAVIFLIWNAAAGTSEFFMTVDELSLKGPDIVNKNLRVSGAVIGDTIQYDADSLTLTFEVAHVPADGPELETEGGLAEALHQAVMDPSRARMTVGLGLRPRIFRRKTLFLARYPPYPISRKRTQRGTRGKSWQAIAL